MTWNLSLFVFPIPLWSDSNSKLMTGICIETKCWHLHCTYFYLFNWQDYTSLNSCSNWEGSTVPNKKNISLVLERFHRRSQYRLIPRHKNSLLNEKCKTVLNNCTRYAHICNVFTRYQHKKMRISYILCCSSLQKSIQDLHKFRRSPSHLEQIGIWMTPSVNGVMSLFIIKSKWDSIIQSKLIIKFISYWLLSQS